jgi:tetratricopeptide (TPR) repeat protein
MRCNTSLMNSWHSFSPNGRWLVFSSKARSPYTQMYLTHLDEDGNDSPAILVDNTTAANRAVNIPEFVNIAPDGLLRIGGPAIDFYRLYDRAMYLQKQRRFDEAVAAWRQVLETDPEDALANSNLAAALLAAGRREEAVVQLRKASELKLRKAAADNPGDPAPHNALGLLLLDLGRPEDAVAEFRTAIRLEPEPNSSTDHANLGQALELKGERDQALAEFHRALEIDPSCAPAHYHLGVAMARQGKTAEAMSEWREAVKSDPGYPEAHDSLAGALYAQGQTAEALAHWRAAIDRAPNDATALRQAAWVLATSSQASLRNGREALVFAVRASELSGGKDTAVLDALAAAYAETGRFTDAVLTVRRALALADTKDAESLKRRMAGYEAGTAFRDR